METLIAEGIANRTKAGRLSAGRSQDFSGRSRRPAGPNGAGKTTSFYIIVGLVQPETGRVLVDSTDITACPCTCAPATSHQLLPQEPSVFRKLTVERIFWPCLKRSRWQPRAPHRTERLIHQLNLGHIRTTRGYALSAGSAAVLKSRDVCASNQLYPAGRAVQRHRSIAVLELQKIIFDLKASGIASSSPTTTCAKR